MNKYKDFDEFDELFEEGKGRDFDFIPALKHLLKHWKRITVWAVCGAAFGMMIGFSTPKTFTTKAVVAPEIATRSTLGNGLSSLASLAGVNMNTMALTDAMHPDLYPEVIKSTNFYIGLFKMPVTIERKDSVIHTDLYDYMVNYNRQPWWSYVLGLPHLAMDGLKSIFVKKDEVDDAEGYSELDSLRLTKQQEMVVKALAKSVTATVEKKTFVLSLKVSMQDRDVAADLANAAIAKLKQFVLDYRTEKARENVDYYEVLLEEARTDYLDAQRRYTRYVDSHQGFASKSAQVEMKHLENEAQLRYQMYNQMAQNLLAAKAKVQQEAPVLVVIQPGIAPHNGKPSKVRLTVLWFVLGALLGSGLVLLKGGFFKKSE